MNVQKNGRGNAHGSFVEPENEIKKYLRMLRKRKWLIFSVATIVFVLWSALMIFIGSKPVYTAHTLLHFQDASSMSAVGGEDRRGVNSSRVNFLESSAVLGPVVEQLQLQLSMTSENVSKDALFDSTHITKESIDGEYILSRNAETGQYDLLYTTGQRGDEPRKLTTFNPENPVQANKAWFKFNPEYLNSLDKKRVEFRIRRFDKAVDDLRDSMQYRWMERRTYINLLISVTSLSASSAAEKANTLTEKFIEFDLSLKNSKTNERLAILENELRLAQADLEEANQRLQSFRERNPLVGVGAGGQTVDQITSLEERRSSLQLKINDIESSIASVEASSDLAGKSIATRELLSYLSSEALPVATAFTTEFAELSNERDRLTSNYGPTHNFVVENQRNLLALMEKVTEAAQEHVSVLTERLNNLGQNIEQRNFTLRTMPQKERELAELRIDQGVKSDLYTQVLARYNAAKIKKQVEVGDIAIVDVATPPPPQSTLRILIKKCLLGLVIGLGMGVVLALVLEFFDKTVQDQEDLQSRLVSIPVLGSIPVINDDNEVPENIKDVKGKRDTKLITLDYSPTLESESYRDLRTKLLFANSDKPVSSILVTSLRPGEGKSLTAANLAVTFAQQKISTLIIDGDLRRGVLHNVFGNKKKPGLSDFLISKATVDYDNVSKLVQKTIVPNLYLVTTGSPIPNPTEMLGSGRMVELLELLKSRFGMVVLDTAPFQASSDAPILSTKVDGVVLVVRADYTNVDHLKQKIHEYANIERKTLGVVLNMVKADMSKQRYQYSYYNY